MKIRINHPAVRALHRAIQRSTELQRQYEGMEMDAEYDGGEWSGPIHDRAITAIEDRIVRTIAVRFGMTPADLDTHRVEANYEQFERFQQAIHPRRQHGN